MIGFTTHFYFTIFYLFCNSLSRLKQAAIKVFIHNIVVPHFEQGAIIHFDSHMLWHLSQLFITLSMRSAQEFSICLLRV